MKNLEPEGTRIYSVGHPGYKMEILVRNSEFCRASGRFQLSLAALVLTVAFLFVTAGFSENTSDCLSPYSLQKGGYVRHNAANKRVIVFVNGIFGNLVTTWQNDMTKKYWPTMLCQDHDFASSDIYVFSFDSPKISTAQTIDELAILLNTFLLSDKVLSSHQQAIFICHSMGGLVVRAFLLKYRLPPKQVPMIYFFATPTTGANIAGLAALVSKNPQLENMRPLKFDGYVGDLQSSWLATSESPDLNYPSSIASFCAYEKLDTDHIRIVERQSATNLCNREANGILADHINIVKPPDERDERYMAFKGAYNRTFDALFPTSIALAEATMR